MANITGQGYNQAFNQAQNQFNTEQGRNLGQFNTEQDRGIRQFNTEQDRSLNQSNFEQGRNLSQFNTEQDRGLRQFNTEQDRSLGQFNTEQDRDMRSAAQNQNYGLAALSAQGNLGQIQRNIANEGVQADRAQFEEERDDPRRQTQFMQSLLQGLPLAAQSYSYAPPSGMSELMGTLAGAQNLLGFLPKPKEKDPNTATPAVMPPGGGLFPPGTDQSFIDFINGLGGGGGGGNTQFDNIFNNIFNSGGDGGGGDGGNTNFDDIYNNIFGGG